MLMGCGHPSAIKPSFYYWKTVYKLDAKESEALQNHNVNQIYIRYFDVGLNNEKKILPISMIQFKALPKQSIIPVVFIKNEVFAQIDKDSIELLADHILHGIKSINTKYSIETFKSLQIDCDWSKGTKEKYFHFIKILKSKIGQVPLSCTIRLHQIKFSDITGIPPCDRGTLMVYNIANGDDINVKNSIFDIDIVHKYIDKIDRYALPLDLAFPIFEQIIAFKYRRVYYSMLRRDLIDTFFSKNPVMTRRDNVYEVNEDMTIGGKIYGKGDLFRYEKIDIDDVIKIKNILTKKIKNKDLSIVLFDLDALNLQKIKDENISALFEP
jgi:hypothetical protein